MSLANSRSDTAASPLGGAIQPDILIVELLDPWPVSSWIVTWSLSNSTHALTFSRGYGNAWKAPEASRMVASPVVRIGWGIS